MSTQQLFAGLTPEQEKDYADEAARRWGESSVRESQRKYASYTAEQKAQIAAEGEAVYRDFLAAMPLGATSPATHAAIERWRRHMAYFWTPNDEQCVALGTMYRDDPAFRKTYDAIHPQLAVFIAEAVTAYVAARATKK